MGTLFTGVISQAVILSDTSFSSYINLNTLFGAVVVLAILFLIMFITYFVNIKPNLNNNSSDNQLSNNSVDNAIAQIVVNEEEDLIGDYELVAVITAAIYASMGDTVPADGLIVRSIRKASSRRWINA